MLDFERDQQVEEQFQSFEEGNDESNQVKYVKVKTCNYKRGEAKVHTELWYGKLSVITFAAMKKVLLCFT